VFGIYLELFVSARTHYSLFVPAVCSLPHGVLLISFSDFFITCAGGRYGYKGGKTDCGKTGIYVEQ